MGSASHQRAMFLVRNRTSSHSKFSCPGTSHVLQGAKAQKQGFRGEDERSGGLTGFHDGGVLEPQW